MLLLRATLKMFMTNMLPYQLTKSHSCRITLYVHNFGIGDLNVMGNSLSGIVFRTWQLFIETQLDTKALCVKHYYPNNS